MDSAVEVARGITEEVWRGGLPSAASLMTVNMPTTLSADTPRRFAGITPTIYGSMFKRHAEGNCFEHAFSGLRIKGEGGDIAALQNQEIALTPIRFALDAKPTQEDRIRFERLS